MADNGNTYSYTDPATGEKVIVVGEEQHNDRFAVLHRADVADGWQFDSAHQLRRTAELAVEHRAGQRGDQRESEEFTLVELSPEPAVTD